MKGCLRAWSVGMKWEKVFQYIYIFNIEVDLVREINRELD